MDILSHFFLPLIVTYALRLDEWFADHILFLFAFLGLIADIDVFLGIHRFFLHSPLLISFIILPPLLFVKEKKRKYLLLTAFFLYSHVVLDFFDGGVPLLYPLTPISIGLDFSLVVEFGSSVSFKKLGVDLIIREPEKIDHEVYSLFMAPGIVSFILYLFIIGRKAIGKHGKDKEGMKK